MSKFKDFWKGLTEMIAEELEGSVKYNEIGDKFHEMAEDEETHAEILEEIEAEKMGIEGAGAIPSSKLAKQDLEGETKKADVITNTQEKLDDLGDKAEEMKTADEVNGVINQIKVVQEKRQKAQLKMRGQPTTKAFKENWKQTNGK